MDEQENKKKGIPNIVLECKKDFETCKLIWDRESILKLITCVLIDNKLIKIHENKPICAISAKDVEIIADKILENIFTPEGIESIICNAINMLIKVTIDTHKQNPEIVIVK